MSHQLRTNFDDLPDSAYVRLKQLISDRIAPCSAATIWRMVKGGEFPEPVKLSGNITAWNVGLVRDWQSTFINRQAEGGCHE
ncbi:MAG: AlpA family phage regulatory protein [Sphingomonadales bacterium]|nr:AlpA family phage regulatory protein [Sphingomonadales bacterium]